MDLMKTVIPLAALLLLTACAAENGARPTEDAPGEAAVRAVPAAQSDTEAQLMFLAEHYALWRVEEESDWWGYAVADLDRNGQLEVISSEDHGTGHYTTTSVRELTAERDGLVLCGQDRSCGEETPELLDASGGPRACGPLLMPWLCSDDQPQTYTAYYDGAAGAYHYLFTDSVNCSGAWYGTFAVQRSFSLQNGSVTGVLLSYEKAAHDGQLEYWDTAGNRADGETAQQAADAYHAGRTPLSAQLLWLNSRSLGELDTGARYALLKSSLDAFQISEC